jgi:hypothetical protein
MAVMEFRLVVARSPCDDAIHSFLVAIDCFAALAMTVVMDHHLVIARSTCDEAIYSFLAAWIASLRSQ